MDIISVAFQLYLLSSPYSNVYSSDFLLKYFIYSIDRNHESYYLEYDPRVPNVVRFRYKFNGKNLKKRFIEDN